MKRFTASSSVSSASSVSMSVRGTMISWTRVSSKSMIPSIIRRSEASRAPLSSPIFTTCSISSRVTNTFFVSRFRCSRKPMQFTHFRISHAKGSRTKESRRRIGDVNSRMPSEWTIAALFGSISPKMTMSSVIMGTTHTRARGPNTCSAMLEASVLAAMFTTLLEIRQTVSGCCTSSMTH